MIGLCCLFWSLVYAETTMYQCTSPLGQVVYTDEPCINGKEITVEPAFVYEAPKYEPIQRKKQPDYEELRFARPIEDEAIESTDGSVTVTLVMKPELMEKHQIRMMVDGRQLKQLWNTRVIKLTGLDHGKHSLQASIINEHGKTVAVSRKTRFFLRDPNKVMKSEASESKAVLKNPRGKNPAEKTGN